MRVSVFIALGGGFACALCACIAGNSIFSSAETMSRAVPVQVTVFKNELRAMPRTKTGPVYRPIIHYQFQFNGLAYESDAIFTFDFRDGGRVWAQDILDRFTIGRTYTGFTDPANPSKSFLIRLWDFWPYGWATVPLLLLAAFCWMLMIPPQNRYDGRPPAMPRPPDGWLAIPLFSPARRRVRDSLWILLMVLIGPIPLWHYFTHAGPDFGSFSYAVSIMYGLAIVWQVVGTLVLHLGSRSLDDALLWIENVAVRGHPLRLRVEQAARGVIYVKQLELTIRCEKLQSGGTGKSHWQRRTLLWSRSLASASRHLYPGERVGVRHAVAMPSEHPASAVSCEWQIEVTTHLARRKRRAVFPITVL